MDSRDFPSRMTREQSKPFTPYNGEVRNAQVFSSKPYTRSKNGAWEQK